MTLRFFRHEDLLTLSGRIDDPAYLTEPLYLTRTFQQTANPSMRTAGQPCIQGDEGVAEGIVPHYFPGKNPFLNEVTSSYGIPLEAVLGGAETMYPDFRKKIKEKYVRPDHCTGFLSAGVPVFEIRKTGGMTDMLIRNGALGKALAQTLGDKSAVLLRGHGAVVVAPTLHLVAGWSYYMSLNARIHGRRFWPRRLSLTSIPKKPRKPRYKTDTNDSGK